LDNNRAGEKTMHVACYGYRYYEPWTGRWLSRDPLGERGGKNLYGFVGNDGVGRADRLGLEVIVFRIAGSTELEGGTNDNALYLEQNKAYLRTIDDYKKGMRSFISRINAINDWNADNWSWSYNPGTKPAISGKSKDDIVKLAETEEKSIFTVIDAGGLEEIKAAVSKAATESSKHAKIAVMVHSDGTTRFPDGTTMGTGEFLTALEGVVAGKKIMLVGCGQRLTGEKENLNGIATLDLTYYERLAFKPSGKTNGTDKDQWGIVYPKPKCGVELNALYPVRGLSKTPDGKPERWEDVNAK
jgi:RHS repeat-associated protein